MGQKFRWCHKAGSSGPAATGGGAVRVLDLPSLRGLRVRDSLPRITHPRKETNRGTSKPGVKPPVAVQPPADGQKPRNRPNLTPRRTPRNPYSPLSPAGPPETDRNPASGPPKSTRNRPNPTEFDPNPAKSGLRTPKSGLRTPKSGPGPPKPRKTRILGLRTPPPAISRYPLHCGNLDPEI